MFSISSKKFTKKIKPKFSKYYNRALEYLYSYLANRLQDRMESERRCKRNLKILSHITGVKIIGISLPKKTLSFDNKYLPILFRPHKLVFIDDPNFKNADIYFQWGFIGTLKNRLKFVLSAQKKPVFFIEDGFFKSIVNVGTKANTDYLSGISYAIDEYSFHFDGSRQTSLERMLNAKDYIIPENELARAKALIDFIVSNKLTKYNHQPLDLPPIGEQKANKILIVDQAYGDFSVRKSNADNTTFLQMLETAQKDNPESEILIKTHPDTLAKNNQRISYFDNIQSSDKVHIINFNCNPYALLEIISKVYVVSSQLGFEALLAGKEVHVFGKPFYAGWGITTDYQKNTRRNKHRTLEEIFYVAYIKYCTYLNTKLKQICTPEEALKHLITLRDLYFETYPERK